MSTKAVLRNLATQASAALQAARYPTSFDGTLALFALVLVAMREQGVSVDEVKDLADRMYGVSEKTEGSRLS